MAGLEGSGPAGAGPAHPGQAGADRDPVFRNGMRTQFRALTEMRWRMLVNSLRSRQNSFELGARIVRTTSLVFLGCAVGCGLGFAAWTIAAHDPLHILTVLLWPVLILWQLLPIVMSSFQEATDLSLLLRFPVSFSSYALLYLASGLFDAGTLVGGICLAGIGTGITIAQPRMVLWTTLVLLLFGIFNLLLTRTIFAWIERWLAQRRTREVMGALFLFALLGLQLFNPAVHHRRNHTSRSNPAAVLRGLHWADRVQSDLPPGLGANALSAAQEGQGLTAVAREGSLALYALAAGGLLGLRLRADYRGESLGEAPKRATAAKAARRRTGWAGGPIGAIVAKELLYLRRSGILLYSMFAPLFMLLIFSGGFAGRAAAFGQYLLPLGAAYSFLGLTRLIYNSLGGEGAGIQIYFLAPVRFRTVMLAKNLVHLALFALELALVCAVVYWRARPSLTMLAVTLAWLLFAVPAQLATANVLSITMAYRMTLTRLSREQGAAGSVLLSLLIQLAVLAVGAAIYLPLHSFGEAKWAPVILLMPAAGSIFAWLQTLDRADGMAEARREKLISVLAKAA
jgi:ABC-2 type transport system permease protein